jgi:hypothetical protein
VKSTASFESLDNQSTTQINFPAATRIGDAFLVPRAEGDDVDGGCGGGEDDDGLMFFVGSWFRESSRWAMLFWELILTDATAHLDGSNDACPKLDRMLFPGDVVFFRWYFTER